MRKTSRFLALLLCCVLLLSAAGNALATGTTTILNIQSNEQFLRFVENCRKDSYSRGVTVRLLSDLDLTGVDFDGIPIFSGKFQGNDHRITGLDLSPTGSTVGFFRYLTEGAIVESLHLEGSVTPGGSACMAGGFVGSNAGTIQNCTFTGTVSGIDSIGGIAGVNTITGIIDSCRVYGSIHGNHFVGGIAGTAGGVLRSCENHAQVNTTIEQNSVELSDITLESITDSELAVTVTDVGGICGTGDGVIRSCVNHGTVGYRQMGYNIGGIAGSYGGYLYDSINYGSVDGRKEVGGIVGQLEPAVSVIYSEDTLQTLQEQMDTMSTLAGSTGSSIQNGSGAISAESAKLEQQIKDAQDALKVLLPEEENPVPPDADALQAAQNALNSSMSGMTESLTSMVTITESTLGTVSSNLQGLSGQMNAISGTIGTASENIGGSISDVSDADTDETLSSKLHRNTNYGHVQGDLNVGGIAGSIAPENDLDPEADVMLIGNTSINFDMQLRSVILACENRGTVSGKKQNAGGIVGFTSMGLIKQCYNYADLDVAAAEYVGGVVGRAGGFVRSCGAKCSLSGSAYVGGIAGAGATVSDCFAIVQFQSGDEKLGSLFGALEELMAENNHYLPTPGDPGAVDGISYEGKAEALDSDAFFALPGLPREFRSVRITLRFTDGTEYIVTVPYGAILYEQIFRDLTAAEKTDALWEGAVTPGEQIYFDTVFTAVGSEHATVLESDATGRSQLPVFLVQGSFAKDAQLLAEPQELPDTIDSWSLTLPQSEAPLKLRYLLPEGQTPEKVLLQLGSDGNWTDTAFTVDASYLVFSVEAGTDSLRLVAAPTDYSMYYLIGGCAAGLILLITVLLILTRKKKRAK